MVTVARSLLAVAATILCACETPLTAFPISKSDHTTQWWSNPSYGPRQHYVHVVRDSRGQLKDVYRYYFDDKGRPVLDGPRDIYRWDHDPGHHIEYRDGHILY